MSVLGPDRPRVAPLGSPTAVSRYITCTDDELIGRALTVALRSIAPRQLALALGISAAELDAARVRPSALPDAACGTLAALIRIDFSAMPLAQEITRRHRGGQTHFQLR
ncbi:MAG: hypothetical protein ACREND_10950 [Gemmatimonadaceae bacterium]